MIMMDALTHGIGVAMALDDNSIDRERRVRERKTEARATLK